MKDYKQEVLNAPRGSFYCVLEDDTDKRGMIAPQDHPYIKVLESRIDTLERIIEQLNVVGKEALTNMGLESNRVITQNAGKIFDNTTVLFNNKDYYGVTVINGYIDKVAKINGVINEFPEDVEKGYYKFVNGEIVLDQKKRDSEVLL